MARNNLLNGFVILALTTLSLKGLAGGAGNGGFIGGSTQKQVIQAVNDLKGKNQVSWAFYNLAKHTPRIVHPRLKEIFAVVYKDGRVHGEAESKFIPSLKGCRSSQFPGTDASTLNQTRADICFNVRKLMRIPPEALPERLIALAAHEIMHHFKYGEKDANLVQSFFLTDGRWMVNENIFTKKIQNIAFQILGTTTSLQDNLDTQQTDLKLCLSLGDLGAKVDTLSHLISMAGQSSEKLSNVSEVEKASWALVKSAQISSGFCEKKISTIMGIPMDAYVELQDRTQLKSHLQKLTEDINNFGWLTQDISGEHWPYLKPTKERTK